MEEEPLIAVHEALLENNMKDNSKKKTLDDDDHDSNKPRYVAISDTVTISDQDVTSIGDANENEQMQQNDWVYREETPEYMKCNIICCNVFEAPQLLTCCGKNVCKRCIESHIQRAALLERVRKPFCPHCRKEEFRLIPNTALELSINQLKVECSYQKNGCVWTGSLKHGNLHLKECKFVLIDCPNQCGCPKFERGKLPSHVTMCPLQYVNCPFQAVGCDSGALFLRTEWSQGHAVGNLHQHLLLIARENVQVLSECKSNSTLRNAIYEKSIKENAEMICYQNGILESLKLAMKSLGDHLQETRHKIASLKHMVASERICLAELERRSEHLENTKASIAVTTEAVKVLSVPKAIGTYASDPLHPITFTINNFKKRIATNDMWLSPPFYTHTGGYKMLILVYPNGYGNAQGKFVSVGLHLLSGEYDDHLKWPFPGAIITITAINQRRMNDKSEHFELVGEDTLYTRSRPFDDNLKCGLRISKYLDHKILSNFLDYRNCLELKLYRIQFLPL